MLSTSKKLQCFFLFLYLSSPLHIPSWLKANSPSTARWHLWALTAWIAASNRYVIPVWFGPLKMGPWVIKSCWQADLQPDQSPFRTLAAWHCKLTGSPNEWIQRSTRFWLSLSLPLWVGGGGKVVFGWEEGGGWSSDHVFCLRTSGMSSLGAALATI